MDFSTLLVVLLASAPCVTSHLAPRTLIYPSNTTATATLPRAVSSHSASDCCFILQETLYEEWWSKNSISTIYKSINLTSITTLITPYINGTVINYETNVHPTRTSSLFTGRSGENPVALYLNDALGPVEKATQLDTSNGGQIVTAGVTVMSPTAFWVYSTVKVINVPAVTDSNGHLVCATSSVMGSVMRYDFPAELAPTFSGINSNAEAYFGIDLPVSVARSRSIPSYSGVIITFPTPYIYIPTREITDSGENRCYITGSEEDYGYVPSSVINYVTDHPDIVSQYPGIASCLPGGPSILYGGSVPCAGEYLALNEIATDLTDLTEHTVVTVSSAVYPPPPLPKAPVMTASHAAPGNTPLQRPQLVAFTPTSTLLASTPSLPPSPASAQVAPPRIMVEGVVAPSGTDIESLPQSPVAQTSAIGAAILSVSQPPATQMATLAAGTVVPPGSQLPSAQMSGAAVAPGQSSLVINSPTTIPVSLATPLSGSTTIISGIPFVIIPSPTTVIFPPSVIAAIPLPSGQTTSIDGTPLVIISGIQTIPVNSIFSVSGITTVLDVITTISGTPAVVGSTTKVVVSGTATIVLPTNLQRTATPSKPAQLTSGVTPANYLDAWLHEFLGLLVLCFFFVI